MSQEKMKILQLIEENIISVDEGLRLLESLNDEKNGESVLTIDQNKTEVKFEEKKEKPKTTINLGKGVEHDEFKNRNKSIKLGNLGKQIEETIESSFGSIENLGKTLNEKLSGLDKWSQKVENNANDFSQKVNKKSKGWEKSINTWADKLEKTIEKNVDQIQTELKKGQVLKEYSPSLDGINALSIELNAGDVSIVTEDREDIVIIAEGVSNENNDPLIKLETYKDGLLIKAGKHSSNQSSFFGLIHIDREVNLKVVMPALYKGALYIKTVSGDVDIRHIHLDSFKFSTISGDLEAAHIIVNNGVLKTSSGDVSIADYAGDLLFSTVSGDIEVNLIKLKSDVNGKTVSGDIDLSMPRDSEFGLYLKTVSGHLECEFPLTMLGGNMKNKLRGKVVSDEIAINIDTTSGDVSVLKV